jgi:hypothetical protein
MSHLACELDRQLVWIERQARELQIAVEQLISEGNALMNGDELWDEGQAGIIRQATNDWADNCGRSIAFACSELNEFRTQLRKAHDQGTDDGHPG